VGAVVDVVEKKLLHRSFLGRKVESVELRPDGGDRSWPHVSIYRGPRLYVWPGNQIPIQEVPVRLAAAGVAAPARPTSGALELLVPVDTTAEVAVALAVATLRALVPTAPGWAWKPVLEGP
jgi:hypothetical protein